MLAIGVRVCGGLRQTWPPPPGNTEKPKLWLLFISTHCISDKICQLEYCTRRYLHLLTCIKRQTTYNNHSCTDQIFNHSSNHSSHLLNLGNNALQQMQFMKQLHLCPPLSQWARPSPVPAWQVFVTMLGTPG